MANTHYQLLAFSGLGFGFSFGKLEHALRMAVLVAAVEGYACKIISGKKRLRMGAFSPLK
jgi:hypothetical protein